VSTNPTERSALRLAVTPLTRVQVRDASGTGDGSWTIEGYAAVYEQETTLYEISGWVRVREEIARGAFTDVLDGVKHGSELVHLNHGHDMKTAVAATDVDGIGGLELSEDFHGERFFARVDPEDPDARALAVKMRRGVVRQASFAFTIDDEELVETKELDDGTLDYKFRILKVGHQYDVCACAQGAYPQTESYLRSLAAASLRVPDLGALGRAGELDLEQLVGPGRRSLMEGGSPVAPAAEPVGEGESRERELLQLQAHARTTTRNLTRRLP
jgi:HK97 family phage prohead protease